MAKYVDESGLTRLIQLVKAALALKADKNHASTGTDYGKGTDSSYGHVKLSDSTSGTSAAASGGTAATPKAVKDALDAAKAYAAASSHTHGDITSGGDITATAPTVASGDKIIINDESASKITNGPSFGTDTTKYLRNDGTWAAPSGATYNDFDGATGSADGSSGLVPQPVIDDYSRYKVLVASGIWDSVVTNIYHQSDYVNVKIDHSGRGNGNGGGVSGLYSTIQAATSTKAGVMTATDKSNLDALVAAGPEANVQSDWNQTNSSADDYIKNKPTIPSGKGVYYGTCSTSEDVSDKVVVCSDFTALETGAVIFVSFNDNHYGAANQTTLNVNNTGAKGLSGFKSGYAYWESHQILSFTYNGSTWQVNDAAYIDTQDTTSAISSADKMYLVGAKIMGPAGRNTYANTKVYATDGAFVCDTIDTGNGAYEINAAAAKAIGSVANGNTGLVTGDAVYDAIQASIVDVVGYLVYKGTVSAASGMTSFKKGWSWIASASFTIGSGNDIKSVEPGDMLIANADGASASTSNIDVIQTNIETLTTTEVATIWTNTAASS